MTIKELIWYGPRPRTYEINLIERIEYLMDKLKEEEKPIIFKTIKFYIETSFNGYTVKVFRSNLYTSNNENYCQFTEEDFEDDYTKSLVVGGDYDVTIKIDDDTTFEQFDEQVYSFYRSIPTLEYTENSKISFYPVIHEHYRNEEAIEKIKTYIEKTIYFKIKQLSYKFPKKSANFTIVLYLQDINHIQNNNASFEIRYTPHLACPSLQDVPACNFNNYNLVFKINRTFDKDLYLAIDYEDLYSKIEEFFKTIPDLPY